MNVGRNCSRIYLDILKKIRWSSTQQTHISSNVSIQMFEAQEMYFFITHRKWYKTDSNLLTLSTCMISTKKFDAVLD